MAEFKPVSVEEFGGLELRGDPGSIGPGRALDTLNVTPEFGQIKTRPGYSSFHTGPSSAYTYLNLFLFPRSGGDQVIATRYSGAAYELVAIDSGGTTVASTASGATASPVLGHFTRFGAPAGALGDERVYAGVDQATAGITTLWKWTGSAWSQPTATVDAVAGRNMPGGRFVAVTPWDQRLVNAHFHVDLAGPNGSGSSVSHVFFSNPGDPEKWTSTDFLQFGPGDGEPITGILAWRDMLFVFKPSRFWVVYSTSTDSTGGAIFNYREVNAGVGLYASQAVTIAPDGVYFLDRSGVYRTTGGIPQLVSSELDPLFALGEGLPGDNDLPFFRAFAFLSSSSTRRHQYSMAFRAGRLWLTVPGAARGSGIVAQYVFERTPTGSWVVHDFPAIHVANAINPSGQNRLAFASYADESIYYLDPSTSTDNGTAISARYRTGFVVPAPATTPSTIREVLLEGSGTVDVKGSTDYGDLGTATSVALGTAPAVAQGRKVAAQQGRRHSYEFSSTSGAWTVNRATLHVESKATPGKQP